jgi:hydroxymethylbilane synthase
LKRPLIVGTRGSKLALRQAGIVAGRLREAGWPAELKVIATEGDQNQQLSLRGAAGAGLFVREIERALLDGNIDLAVHSLKDLPIETAPGLRLAAFLTREDPREALLLGPAGALSDLGRAARIGTSSLRRVVQLRQLFPDACFQDIRGNIDTRIRKLSEGLYDGIILAVAGLNRLNLDAEINRIFTPEQCLPAPGQGVITVQVRAEFAEPEIYDCLNDPATAGAVRAERAFLQQLGGGCRLPVGALAEIRAGKLILRGMVADSRGATVLKRETAGPLTEPETLGRALADWFIGKGIVDWT